MKEIPLAVVLVLFIIAIVIVATLEAKWPNAVKFGAYVGGWTSFFVSIAVFLGWLIGAVGH
jgi:hypothetical protein